MISPSKITLPFSFIAATARATSEVSKSSCLSGGTAALRYANNAEIDMSSVDSYVDAKRYSTEENMNCFLKINFNGLEHGGRQKTHLPAGESRSANPIGQGRRVGTRAKFTVLDELVPFVVGLSS